MSQLLRLPAESLRGAPCAKGTAVITTIARGPDDDAWQWQMTLIGMEQEVDFPAHADLRRHFVPLDAPVDIAFADGRTQHLTRFQIAQFDQHNEPQACLPTAPTLALAVAAFIRSAPLLALITFRRLGRGLGV